MGWIWSRVVAFRRALCRGGCCVFASLGLCTASAAEVTRVSAANVPASPLVGYYAQMEAALLARGYLRQESRKADAIITAAKLERSFHAIALSREYGGQSPLMRWEKPVSLKMTFGPSIPKAQRESDSRTVKRYVSRLASVTGHPIRMSQRSGTFEVLVATSTELRGLGSYLQRSYPGLDQRMLRKITRMPKSYLCMVVAFPNSDKSKGYTRALAIVRAEHSQRMRTACFHEEIAQGLGLPNDSDARPSIFNDDEEFAVLTRHDELLLRMLYDDRLRSGMTARQAGPQVSAIAQALAR